MADYLHIWYVINIIKNKDEDSQQTKTFVIIQLNAYF